MEQVWKPNWLTNLYVFSVCLMVYATAEVSWLMRIPRQPLYIMVGVLGLLKIMQKGAALSNGRVTWIFVWFIYTMMSIVVIHGTIAVSFYYLLFFFSMTTVIVLSYDEMKYLLKAFTDCFLIMLLISIPAWILYLMGLSLPYTGPHFHSDNFHVYYDYYFFTTQVGIVDYARFSSVFLEPGQMATPCVFLFHLNTREGGIFRFRNVIFLIAIIMSFSLIAYGLLLFSIVVNQVARSQNRYKFHILVATLSVLGGLSWYFVTHEDNAVNALIVARLQYDEQLNTISGYNRTGETFEAHYASFIKSPSKYFGARSEIRNSFNWTTHASGYKKFIVFHGIVGFALVLLLMVILLFNNKSRAAFFFFVMVILAFLVRDLLTSSLWLSITIIGMYILGYEKSNHKSKKVLALK